MPERITPINCYYPVGSIYITTNDSNPKDLFGGNWERLSGRFLIGCGGSSGLKGGETGGSWEHTLTVNNLPVHDHSAGGIGTDRNLAYIRLTKQGDTNTSVIGGTGAMGWADNVANNFKGNPTNFLPAAWNLPFSYQGSGSATTGDMNPAEVTYITNQTYVTETDKHSHNLTGDLDSTGGNQSITTRPPYYALNMWYRVS